MLVKELFTRIFEMLVQEESEETIRSQLGGFAAREAGHQPSDCRVSPEDTKMIRSHLEALGLMQLKRQERERHGISSYPYKEAYIAWSVTEKRAPLYGKSVGRAARVI